MEDFHVDYNNLQPSGIKRTAFGVFIPRSEPLPFLVTNRKDDGATTETLTHSQERQVKKIISDFADKAWKISKDKFHNKYNTDGTKWRDNYKIMERIELSFQSTLKQQCDSILNASKIKESLLKKIKEAEEAHKNRRKELANNIFTGRKLLLKLKEDSKLQKDKYDKLCELTQTARRNYKLSTMAAECSYPPVPSPSVTPHPDGFGLPNTSGIYFIWDCGLVEYVGQSVALRNRLKLGSHHRLQETDRISFLELPLEVLTWAECYYIGICRPTRNGGTPCRGPKELGDDR